MKKLQILGTGCTKCRQLYERTEEAAKSLGIDYDIEKVEDINKILSYGILMTPALVVDGEVVLSGRVPAVDDIKKLIS